jgi:hypothetical protein
MITINEYRNKFQPKYEYFARYRITFNDYDEEIANNLIHLIDSYFIVYGIIKDLGPRGIEFMIHNDNINYINKSFIEDFLNEYDYGYIANIESIGCPNVYKDDKWYWIESQELASRDELEEMWSNSFVGYGDYDDNYPTTFNAFVRQCVDGNELKLVEWITE